MSTGTKVVIGVLVTAIVLGLTCVGGAVAFVFWVDAQTPEGITLQFDYPDDVVVGDEFDTTITIVNLQDQPRTLVDLDFYSPILDGVSILAMNPNPSSDVDGSDGLFGSRTLSYNKVIPAEGELVIVITMTAQEAGQFTGDVDVSIDKLLAIYSTTQTIVIDE